jgi:Chaperone of endosialidase
MSGSASREDVLSRVRRLRGVSYEWREGEEHRGRTGRGRELGVIAQEVEAVFPELVTTGADGFKRVDYLGLIPVLIEAVKELDERLRKMEEGYYRDARE